MKFKDWYQFNFVDNKVMDCIGDIYIKVFRKKSFASEDKCFQILMKMDDAVKMFGEYPLMKIGFHHEQRDCGDYKTLSALLYLEEVDSE